MRADSRVCHGSASRPTKHGVRTMRWLELFNRRRPLPAGFSLRMSLALAMAMATATATATASVASVAYAENARIDYYDVTGTTASALRNELNARGPLGKAGKRFDALTKWRVTWKYRYQPVPAGCRFTDMRVATSGTILMPHWVHPGDVSATLVRKWQDYLAALLVHEEVHYAHATSAAEEVTVLGQKFQDYSGDCAAMVRAFNSQADLIIDKYKAMDVRYDEVTGHGRTQGARFP